MISFIKECEHIPNGFYIKTGCLTTNTETDTMSSMVTRGKDGLIESIYYIPKEEKNPNKVWFTLGFKLWQLHLSVRVRDYQEPNFIWRFS